MAATVEQDIFRGLRTHVDSWPLPADWTMAANVALPGLSFTPPTGKPYVSIEIHFNRSIETDLSLEMDPIRQGFMRTNVHWPVGKSHDFPLAVAASLRAHFKRGTKIVFDGTVIRIDEDPEIGVFVTGTSHVTLPVTTRWRCYPQVPA
ncbi:MAG TPA: phage tail terminator-like protein [Pseudorhizobium sp.]|jgi:hypothetical protein|nr:phage tail terminator-like protein [Pseudorhizobium sp.]